MNDIFSKRRGYQSPDKEITIREDAPVGLRMYLPAIYYELKREPSEVRALVCRTLRIAPDADNWSEIPNIQQEVQYLLADCEWFKIYDIIEKLAVNLTYPEEKEFFHKEINSFFHENGIGWKLIDNLIELRGDKEFETAISVVEVVLEERGIKTAQTEIKEAIIDMSRRPNPDITGAIQHSLAALECVVREVTGSPKQTLGDLIKNNNAIVPSPLDVAITKMWGFSSEQGRHLQEGREPSFEEAELMVHLSASICTYLSKKNFKIVEETEDKLPF